MNYLIISPIAMSVFLAPHLGMSKDVEKVYFYVINSEMKHVGKDMNNFRGWEKFELIHDMGKVLNTVKPDNLTIIIDDVGIGELGKFLRSKGYKVIGGTPLTDDIEEERQFATDLMGRIMNVPDSVSFQSWKQTFDYVKSLELEERLVFKPNDSFAPKEYTYISKDVDDMLDTMKEFKEHWKWKEDFQIQKFVKGTEVDFGAYFNGKEFIENSMMIYYENKPIMNDDIGPASGGAIAVEFARPLKGLFGDILNKLKPALQKAGYMGQISCNSIVSDDDKKPYFLEFCGRFGYPQLPMDITLLEDNDKTFHELCQAMVKQESGKGLFPTNKIAATLSIGVPPYPMKDGVEKTRGVAMSWDKKWDTYFYPYFPMYEKNTVCMSGVAGDALNITCVDQTLEGAVSMIYDTYLPTLRITNGMWRTDLGKSAKKRIQATRDAKII